MSKLFNYYESYRRKPGAATAGQISTIVKGLATSALSPRSLVHETFDAVSQKVEFPFNEPSVLPAVFDLAQRLNPTLGQYDFVVGEDTSGRVPALLFRRLVNMRRAEMNLPNAKLGFLNGRYDGDPLPKGTYTQATPGSRALIVSEFICSGGSVRRVYNLVRQDRDATTIDIASLGKLETPYALYGLPVTLYVAAQHGERSIDNILYSSFEPRVKLITGVVKPPTDSPHTVRVAYQPEVRQATTRVRQDIRTVVEALYPLLPPLGVQSS